MGPDGHSHAGHLTAQAEHAFPRQIPTSPTSAESMRLHPGQADHSLTSGLNVMPIQGQPGCLCPAFPSRETRGKEAEAAASSSSPFCFNIRTITEEGKQMP